MSYLALRPTFDLALPHPRSEVTRRIVEQLDSGTWSWECHRFEGYLEMHIPKSRSRYWSPHLSLSFEEREGVTSIHGRFAPRQEVWTLVWVAYLAFAFIGFFALMFAYSMWHANQSSLAWCCFPLSMAGIGGLYVVSYVGQSWSHDQMDELRSQWLSLVHAAFPDEPIL